MLRDIYQAIMDAVRIASFQPRHARLPTPRADGEFRSPVGELSMEADVRSHRRQVERA